MSGFSDTSYVSTDMHGGGERESVFWVMSSQQGREDMSMTGMQGKAGAGPWHAATRLAPFGLLGPVLLGFCV